VLASACNHTRIVIDNFHKLEDKFVKSLVVFLTCSKKFAVGELKNSSVSSVSKPVTGRKGRILR
jgi:hypothetical protein